MLEEKNVKFYMNNGVAEVQGENGKVRLLKKFLKKHNVLL